jgi:hypothetical protein
MLHLKFGPELFPPFSLEVMFLKIDTTAHRRGIGVRDPIFTFLSAVSRHVPLGEQFPEVSTYQALQIRARLRTTIPAINVSGDAQHLRTMVVWTQEHRAANGFTASIVCKSSGSCVSFALARCVGIKSTSLSPLIFCS